MLIAPIASINAGGADLSEEDQAGLRDDDLSDLGRFVIRHLPLIDQFELARHNTDSQVLDRVLADDHHFARFPGGKKRINLKQLNDALRGCVPSDRMTANKVAITIHYDCPHNQRLRLVYNFNDQRIERVLVGDVPRKLRCLDGICIDRAEK